MRCRPQMPSFRLVCRRRVRMYRLPTSMPRRSRSGRSRAPVARDADRTGLIRSAGTAVSPRLASPSEGTVVGTQTRGRLPVNSCGKHPRQAAGRYRRTPTESPAPQEQTRWELETLEGLDAHLRLPSIACTVPLAEVYERIVFPQAEGI